MAHSAQGQPSNSDLIRFAKWSALDMGTEDINGFWELFWAMRTDFPDVDDDLLLHASQRALADLVEYQLVRVIWWDPETDTDTDVTPAEAARLISEQVHWEPPHEASSVHLRFIATQSGNRAYYGGLTASP
jgi:hypothetical protein